MVATTTTFFRYFQNKGDLFLAWHSSMHRDFEDEVRNRPPGVSLIEAARTILPKLMEEKPVRRADFEAVQDVPELVGRMREDEERMRTLITEELAKDLGMEAGDLQPQIAAGAVVGAFDAAQRAWLEAPKDTSIDDHLMAAFDVVERFLEPLIHAARADGTSIV